MGIPKPASEKATSLSDALVPFGGYDPHAVVEHQHDDGPRHGPRHRFDFAHLHRGKRIGRVHQHCDRGNLRGWCASQAP
jgi:hypothetical protein